MSIAQALKSIPDTGWDEDFIGFGATANMTGADGSSDSGPYSLVYGLVDRLIPLYGGVAGEQRELTVLGFDLQKAPFTVTVAGGTSADTATMLFGTFDPAGIGKKLAATGFTRSGSAGGAATWAYKTSGDAPEYPSTADDDSVPGAVSVTPSSVVFAATASPVAAISAPAARTLSQAATVDDLANCVGSATAGVIGRLYQQSGMPGPTHAALGFTAGSGKTITVDICVAADSTAAAQVEKANWISGVNTGNDSRSGEAWSALLTDPQGIVDRSTHVVRLSAQLTAHTTPSEFLNSYLSGQITALILPSSS
jgi:hypothetical protein